MNAKRIIRNIFIGTLIGTCGSIGYHASSPNSQVSLAAANDDIYALSMAGMRDEIKRDKITLKKGDPLYIQWSLFDRDGVRSHRVFVNDTLITNFPGSQTSSGSYSTNVAGVINGRKFDTSEEHFRYGSNLVSYELTDAKGNVTGKSIEVLLEE